MLLKIKLIWFISLVSFSMEVFKFKCFVWKKNIEFLRFGMKLNDERNYRRGLWSVGFWRVVFSFVSCFYIVEEMFFCVGDCLSFGLLLVFFFVGCKLNECLFIEKVKNIWIVRRDMKICIMVFGVSIFIVYLVVKFFIILLNVIVS